MPRIQISQKSLCICKPQFPLLETVNGYDSTSQNSNSRISQASRPSQPATPKHIVNAIYSTFISQQPYICFTPYLSIVVDEAYWHDISILTRAEGYFPIISKIAENHVSKGTECESDKLLLHGTVELTHNYRSLLGENDKPNTLSRMRGDF